MSTPSIPGQALKAHWKQRCRRFAAPSYARVHSGDDRGNKAAPTIRFLPLKMRVDKCSMHDYASYSKIVVSGTAIA